MPSPAISIFEIQNGQIVSNGNQISELLLKEFPDKKVAFWSIAGFPGSGKSFLLGELHKCLMRKVESKFDSVINKTNRVKNGVNNKMHVENAADNVKAIEKTPFIWCNSIRINGPYSRAICTNFEPILVGKQLVLFLLDTPGIDIHQWPQSLLLTALASKISSIQILNFNAYDFMNECEQIEDAFSLMDTILKRLAIEAGEFHAQNKLSTLLLVRDWYRQKEKPHGFAGGQQFYHEQFGRHPRLIEQMQTIFGDLKKTNGCFLMPSPGDKLVEADSPEEFYESGGKLSEKFRMELDILAEELLKMELSKLPGAMSCAEMANILNKFQQNLDKMQEFMHKNLELLEYISTQKIQQRESLNREEILSCFMQPTSNEEGIMVLDGHSTELGPNLKENFIHYTRKGGVALSFGLGSPALAVGITGVGAMHLATGIGGVVLLLVGAGLVGYEAYQKHKEAKLDREAFRLMMENKEKRRQQQANAEIDD